MSILLDLGDGTNRLLSEAETAKLLSVAAGTLQKWRHRKVGPNYTRISTRAIRYQLADIIQWLEQSNPHLVLVSEPQHIKYPSCLISDQRRPAAGDSAIMDHVL